MTHPVNRLGSVYGEWAHLLRMTHPVNRLGSARHGRSRVEGRLSKGAPQSDVTGLQDAAVLLLVPQLRVQPVREGLAQILRV